MVCQDAILKMGEHLCRFPDRVAISKTFVNHIQKLVKYCYYEIGEQRFINKIY